MPRDENKIMASDLDCTAQTRASCASLCQQLSLPSSFTQIIQNCYLPLSRHIMESKHSGPLLVSINGAQGTGKSTLTAFVRQIIESEYKLQVAAFSLDDFYYTRHERQQLGKEIHPLLLTRGVPGTHDISLIENVLDSLLSGRQCHVPVFNKAMDDRCDVSEWVACHSGVDVILFEGWCNNSPVQNKSELSNPINELEQKEDPRGVWRSYVNEKLGEYHQRFFNQADLCVMLKAPDFEHIYSWRSLQEQKLRSAVQADQQAHIMSQDELKRFIQHYERISRHTLRYLPEKADLVLPVKADHSIAEMIKSNDDR